MARNKYQRGSLKKVGRYWQARWREYVKVEGQVVGIPKKKMLCLVSEFPTEKLAQREFDRKILNAINDQVTAPMQACTFSDFVEKWKVSVMSQFKLSSQSSMGCEITKHLVPFFGRMPLSEINGEDVQRFIASRTQSAKYTRNLIADAKTIWRSAIEWSYVTHNPFAGVRLPKVHKKKAPCFTLDEITKIMGVASEPLRTMYWVAATLGHRGCEAVVLRVRNIDFANQQISIVESQWNGKLQAPKSDNGIRRFSMGKRLTEHLRSWCMGKQLDDFVFLQTPRKNGKPRANDGRFRQDSVQKILKRLLFKLGICCHQVVGKDGTLQTAVKPDYGLHSFRHANATFMDQLNAPAAVRMQRIGHGELATTMNYTHMVDSDDRRIAQGIEDMIFGETVQ